MRVRKLLSGASGLLLIAVAVWAGVELSQSTWPWRTGGRLSVRSTIVAKAAAPSVAGVAIAERTGPVAVWFPLADQTVELADSLVGVQRLAFSPTGAWLVACRSNAPTVVFDLAAGGSIALPDETTGAVDAAASMDGSLIALGFGRRLEVWRLGEEALPERVMAVDGSPGSMLFSVAGDALLTFQGPDAGRPSQCWLVDTGQKTDLSWAQEWGSRYTLSYPFRGRWVSLVAERVSYRPDRASLVVGERMHAVSGGDAYPAFRDAALTFPEAQLLVLPDPAGNLVAIQRVDGPLLRPKGRTLAALVALCLLAGIGLARWAGRWARGVPLSSGGPLGAKTPSALLVGAGVALIVVLFLEARGWDRAALAGAALVLILLAGMAQESMAGRRLSRLLAWIVLVSAGLLLGLLWGGNEYTAEAFSAFVPSSLWDRPLVSAASLALATAWAAALLVCLRYGPPGLVDPQSQPENEKTGVAAN